MKILSLGNRRGVVMLQAIVLVNIIAITAAAMMVLVLGGFQQAIQVEQSVDNRGAADSATGMAQADIACLDPALDGTPENTCIVDADACNACLCGWAGPGPWTLTCDVDPSAAVLNVTVNVSYDNAVNVQAYRVNANAQVP